VVTLLGVRAHAPQNIRAPGFQLTSPPRRPPLGAPISAGRAQDKARSNAAGQRLRADEAGPSKVCETTGHRDGRDDLTGMGGMLSQACQGILTFVCSQASGTLLASTSCMPLCRHVIWFLQCWHGLSFICTVFPACEQHCPGILTFALITCFHIHVAGPDTAELPMAIAKQLLEGESTKHMPQDRV